MRTAEKENERTDKKLEIGVGVAMSRVAGTNENLEWENFFAFLEKRIL